MSRIKTENNPTCYCEERKNNPEGYRSIPEGYCGICDVCGEPGHMRAHPHYATTGAWCDEHWNDIISGRTFGLHEMILYVLVAISLCAAVGYLIIKWLL